MYWKISNNFNIMLKHYNVKWHKHSLLTGIFQRVKIGNVTRRRKIAMCLRWGHQWYKNRTPVKNTNQTANFHNLFLSKQTDNKWCHSMKWTWKIFFSTVIGKKLHSWKRYVKEIIYQQMKGSLCLNTPGKFTLWEK